jgi:hypothetical protein
MTNPIRSSASYRKATAALKAQGDTACWSCGKALYANLKYPHPNSITLGHYTAIEDGGDLLDPNNHGPQCINCNMADGAHRTNNKRRGLTNYQDRKSWVNDTW